jgi:hypothetical protein
MNIFLSASSLAVHAFCFHHKRADFDMTILTYYRELRSDVFVLARSLNVLDALFHNAPADSISCDRAYHWKLSRDLL